jgi:drug/metabolite transporter (DMT)-like permease
MPAWGTLIEVFLMRRPFTKWRAAALALSLSGMLAILSPARGNPTSVNIGDLMALLSGIIFAFGAMRVRQALETSVFEQVFAFFFYGLTASLALTLLPQAAAGRSPTTASLAALAPWLILVAAGFLIPVMSGIYWGSKHVDPGRLGILLQIEAVVGIASAALFAGEPFGPRQAIGAVLVVSAGLVEVIGNREGSKQGLKVTPLS